MFLRPVGPNTIPTMVVGIFEPSCLCAWTFEGVLGFVALSRGLWVRSLDTACVLCQAYVLDAPELMRGCCFGINLER